MSFFRLNRKNQLDRIEMMLLRRLEIPALEADVVAKRTALQEASAANIGADMDSAQAVVEAFEKAKDECASAAFNLSYANRILAALLEAKP